MVPFSEASFPIWAREMMLHTGGFSSPVMNDQSEDTTEGDDPSSIAPPSIGEMHLMDGSDDVIDSTYPSFAVGDMSSEYYDSDVEMHLDNSDTGSEHPHARQRLQFDDSHMSI